MNGRPLAGAGQNLRAVRLLDFFDRCAIPCCPSSATGGGCRRCLRVMRGLQPLEKALTRKEFLRFYKTNYTQISTFLQQISIINSVLSVQKYYQKGSNILISDAGSIEFLFNICNNLLNKQIS